MTRKEAKEWLPIIQAWAEGKPIQYQSNQKSGWVDINKDLYTSNPPSNYRIKPEPKYRPFKNQEECWKEMLNHKPFAWVKEKYSDRYNTITEVNGLSIKVKEVCLFTDGVKYYTFADGTPFGIKEG